MQTSITSQEQKEYKNSESEMNSLIWNLSSIISNIVCAPNVRALKISQVFQEQKAKGWKPLSIILIEKEGVLGGFRGYFSRGLNFMMSEFYNSQFGNFDRFQSLLNLCWWSPVMAFFLSPFYTLEACQTLDLGLAKNECLKKKIGETNLKEIQEYDGMFDTCRKIWKCNGILGFYKSWFPLMLKIFLKDLHFVQWMAFGSLMQGSGIFGEILTQFGFLISSEILVYPIEKICQLQAINIKKGQLSFKEQVKKIFQNSGLMGFWAGWLSYDYIIGTFSELGITMALAMTFTTIHEISKL